MSSPKGHTIEQIVLLTTEDGKEFIRFDTNDEDGTCMFAWDMADVAKWLATNYVSPEVEVIDARESDGLDDEPDDDPSWSDGDALASAGWGTDEDYGAY